MDFVEELSNPMISPIFSQMRQDVPKSIRPRRKGNRVKLIQPGGYPEDDVVCGPSWLLLQALKGHFPLMAGNRDVGWEKGPLLGDGAIDVRDHHLVIPVPQVDGGLTAACALVLSRDTECHLVGAILQIQPSLWQGENKSGTLAPSHTSPRLARGQTAIWPDQGPL